MIIEYVGVYGGIIDEEILILLVEDCPADKRYLIDLNQIYTPYGRVQVGERNPNFICITGLINNERVKQ